MSCKITQVNDVFFTSAQFAGVKDGFTVREVATKAIRMGGSISEVTSNFSNLIEKPIRDFATYVIGEDPLWVAEQFPDDVLLEIAFFSFENGKPALCSKTYKLSFVWSGVELDVRPKNWVYAGDNTRPFLFLGYDEPLIDLIKKEPDYWTKGLAQTVNDLIQVAIEKNSHDVGPPVSILQIDISGARWVQQANCPPVNRL